MENKRPTSSMPQEHGNIIEENSKNDFGLSNEEFKQRVVGEPNDNSVGEKDEYNNKLSQINDESNFVDLLADKAVEIGPLASECIMESENAKNCAECDVLNEYVAGELCGKVEKVQALNELEDKVGGVVMERSSIELEVDAEKVPEAD